MLFLFETSTSMKPYNSKKWFIMHDFVRPMRIDADSVDDALIKYQRRMENQYGITITKSGLRRKQPMYKGYKNGEPKQVGWVLTGKTTFRDDVNNCWSDQYIDCWVEIVKLTEFEDIA